MAAPSEYCQPEDVYKYAVPPGTFPAPARLVGSVVAGTDVLTLDQHGYADDEPVTLRAESGGSLPAPLVEGTTYYVRRLTDSTFQLSATEGGAAIDLTTDGENVLVIQGLPFTQAIRSASAEVDEMTGHATPIEADADGHYPEAVKTYAAVRTAEIMLIMTGQSQAILGDRMAVERAKLDRWRKGVAIRGPHRPASANLALKASSSATDPRGWEPCGGGLP